jgi:hypothetical protein
MGPVAKLIGSPREDLTSQLAELNPSLDVMPATKPL